MLTLTACATSPGSPTNGVVRIPRDCENLAEPVPYPPVTKGQNAKAAVARHRAALGQANGRLVATHDCQARQRERFAKGF
jgi:hypothetical protein